MFAKISKSVLAAVTLTILILSAVFYWFIPGWILAALSFVWMLAEAARAFDRAGLFVLVPIVALLVLGFGVWLPISLAGLVTGMDEAMFVIGGMAAAMTQAYVWAK